MRLRVEWQASQSFPCLSFLPRRNCCGFLQLNRSSAWRGHLSISTRALYNTYLFNPPTQQYLLLSCHPTQQFQPPPFLDFREPTC